MAKKKRRRKCKRVIGFFSIFAAALLAYNLFAEQLTIYAANRVIINDSLTGAELASIEINGSTGNPLSSDWIFGASYTIRPEQRETDSAPVYKLGHTYQGNHVTAVNESAFAVKLTARVIAAPIDNSEAGPNDTPLPRDEIRPDWSNPQDVIADWRDLEDVDPRDPDWGFFADGEWQHNDYEKNGGVKTERTVLERTETKIVRLGAGDGSVIPKKPEQPGLVHGMTLDMGVLQPGESSVYGFEMTLPGRNYWNASQRARAVFYLEFTATYIPSETPPPTETPPVETPENTTPEPSASETPSITSSETPESSPTPSTTDDGKSTDQNRDKPKTGDTRVRLYFIFIAFALILAYLMLRERDKEKDNTG